MCTAIAQPKGANTMTIETLESGWASNPDGGGYAFIDGNNKLNMRHFMDRDEFILSYLADHEENGEQSPFLVHVRIATHGSVGILNCHPFDVPMEGDSETAMIHNGILSAMDEVVKGTDLTDSEGLIEQVITRLGDEWLDNPHLVDMVEDFIGSGNKLAFLSTNPLLEHELYILNESAGVWDGDTWFSNYSCFVYETSKTVYGYDYDWYNEMGYNYTSYTNGTVKEGTVKHTSSIDDFGTWLIAPEDRRETAVAMANATKDEHVIMFNNSLAHEDACAVCTGIKRCLCDDICNACYEAYHECDCDGKFVSLDDTFTDGWTERVTAIAESTLTPISTDDADTVIF